MKRRLKSSSRREREGSATLPCSSADNHKGKGKPRSGRRRSNRGITISSNHRKGNERQNRLCCLLLTTAHFSKSFFTPSGVVSHRGRGWR